MIHPRGRRLNKVSFGMGVQGVPRFAPLSDRSMLHIAMEMMEAMVGGHGPPLDSHGKEPTATTDLALAWANRSGHRTLIGI